MSSTATKTQRNWLELPSEVTASVLSRLSAVEILICAQYVCSLWRNICKDPLMWRSIVISNKMLSFLWNDNDLRRMCVDAVDRSSGHLLEIDIEGFGTDKLLSYIIEKSFHLKRLRLVSCYNISDKGLSQAALKLQFLEEVEISRHNVSKDALAIIGRNCPLLKSLKFNIRRCRPFVIYLPFETNYDDDDALAIAENMPELRQLQLLENKLTNQGLKAILDSCPHLQCLDLRGCFNVHLKGDLEKRCLQGIKNLLLPRESTRDCELYAQQHYIIYD